MYAFKQADDGILPAAPLIAVGGTFYGTTSGSVPPSGSASRIACYNGCGTVFSLTPDGTETVLHYFQGGADGATPMAPLLDNGGVLVGTTTKGGLGNGGGRGVAFTVSPDGQSHPFFAFTKSVGVYPAGALAKLGARIYGVTNGLDFTGLAGSVYAITPSGTVRQVRAFGTPGDGTRPDGGLLPLAGILYGTTARGGSLDGGTVFALAPSGQEVVLHSFDPTQGAYPSGELIQVGGILYGEAAGGGPFADKCGALFRLSTGGAFQALHVFDYNFHRPTAEGCGPIGGLTRIGNILYGVTGRGGGHDLGTVFSLTQTGVVRVLHEFAGGSDGAIPAAKLLAVNGVLYGTTFSGGAYNRGTVFKVVP